MKRASISFPRRRRRLGDAHGFCGRTPAVDPEFEHAEALALHDHMMAAIGRGQVARDVGDRADAVHVGAVGLRDLAVALHENADLPLLAHGLLHGRDRDRPPDRDREQHAGKQHRSRTGRMRSVSWSARAQPRLPGLGPAEGASPRFELSMVRLLIQTGFFAG